MFAEQFVVDPWLVVKPLEKTRRYQLHQVVIALGILAEQDQMVRSPRSWLKIIAVIGRLPGLLPAVESAALGNVNFTTDDRLYISLAGFVEEIRRREEIPVVGYGHRRHLLPRRFIKQLGSLARPVQQAVVRMNVQVNKLGVAHELILIPHAVKCDR